MRVLLVGSAAERAALRAKIDAPMEIAGEFASLAAARATDVDADAIVLAHAPADAVDAFDEPLTPREVEVVELLAEGLPNKAIAARLGISDQTVKFHLASIAGKLGAANRTDTVRRAARRGLIAL
jgi:DNA-binding NarL/FixJ family response regulator